MGHDARFEETFENVYTADSLQDIPFYVVAGNHDWLGNVSAQIGYSTLSARWIFPYYFYTRSFSWPGETRNVTMDIVFIDTILLSGNSDLLEDKFGELQGPSDPVTCAQAQTHAGTIQGHRSFGRP